MLLLLQNIHKHEHVYEIFVNISYKHLFNSKFLNKHIFVRKFFLNVVMLR